MRWTTMMTDTKSSRNHALVALAVDLRERIRVWNTRTAPLLPALHRFFTANLSRGNFFNLTGGNPFIHADDSALPGLFPSFRKGLTGKTNALRF
jgi:hypothetical protein